MTVLVPADAVEMEKCMAAIVEYVGPVAIRFGREKVPVITSASTPFVIGKSTVLREGKDVTIIGIGSLMLYEAMLAADELAKKNISVRIINMYSVKPIDKEAIIKACEETKGIVTVEEHTVMGGFGSAVAEVVVQNKPVKMRLVGTQDRFGESGKPAELLQEFGLTSPFIQKAVLEVLK